MSENPEDNNFEEDSLQSLFKVKVEETTLPSEPPTIPTPERSDKKRRIFGRKSARNTEPKQKPIKPVPAMPRGGLAKPVAEIYRKIGETWALVDPGCGNSLIQAADACGHAWEELARQNPAVRRFLLAVITTSATGELFMAHLPILAAAALHHVPAVRGMFEKMAADAGEMFAKMAAESKDGDKGE